MDEKSVIIEEWRWIEGYDNYEVSSLGRVRVRKMLKPSETNGYQYVGLSQDGIQKHHLIHVLVAEAFIGPRPEGMDCCHLDGNRDNNSLENLEWNTRSKNIKDRWKHQREREAAVRAKLMLMLESENPAIRDDAAELIEILKLG